jgi:hypothetical protein
MRPRRIIRSLDPCGCDKRPNSTELMLRYLDGSLSAEHVQRLDEQLRRDPRLRKQFARLLLAEQQLEEIAQERRCSAFRRFCVRRIRGKEASLSENYTLSHKGALDCRDGLQ